MIIILKNDYKVYVILDVDKYHLVFIIPIYIIFTNYFYWWVNSNNLTF